VAIQIGRPQIRDTGLGSHVSKSAIRGAPGEAQSKLAASFDYAAAFGRVE
jgi:hypothetical protein